MFLVIDENIDIRFIPDKSNFFNIKNYEFSETNIEFLKFINTLNIKQNKKKIKNIYENNNELFFILKSLFLYCYANFFTQNILEEETKEVLKFLKNAKNNDVDFFDHNYSNILNYKIFCNKINSIIYTKYNSECCFTSNIDQINYENEINSILQNSQKQFYKNNEIIPKKSKKYIISFYAKESKKEINFISFLCFCLYMYYFYKSKKYDFLKDYVNNIKIVNFSIDNNNNIEIKNVFCITKIFEIYEKNNFLNKKIIDVIYSLNEGNSIYINNKKNFLYIMNFFSSINYIINNKLLKDNHENFMFYSFFEKSDNEQKEIINEIFKNLSKKSKKTIKPSQMDSFKQSYYFTILKNDINPDDIIIILKLINKNKINFHSMLSKSDIYSIIKTINNIKNIENIS